MGDNDSAVLGSEKTFAVPLPAVTTLSISGSEAVFPVRRIYCIGRNFAAHAIEMGHNPDREPPFFFQKNPDNIIAEGTPFPYPPKSTDVHFEIEMVVALGKGGKDIPVTSALDHVFGYAVGLDMTRRDLQGEAKDLRRPWEIGKSFESSAPCGKIVPASISGHPDRGVIWLDVNGERRQTGDLDQMIWKVPEIINYLSEYFVLAPGDLIFSGTPSGVGAVARGDHMAGHVEGVGDIEFSVV